MAYILFNIYIICFYIDSSYRDDLKGFKTQSDNISVYIIKKFISKRQFPLLF